MKTKTKTVYKVVVKQRGTFWSYAKFLVSNKYALEYKLGKTTVPKIGKLFVFKRKKDAKDFFKQEDLFNIACIMKGKAVNVEQGTWRCDLEGSFEEFWEAFKKNISYYDVCQAPQGTFICDSFTPEEIIDLVDLKKSPDKI